MLARISGRMRELAIRTALGARPSRLLQQLATESLVLSLGAAVVGIALAEGIVAGLRPLLASEYPDLRFARLDAQVVLFAVGLAALTALLFGVFPSIAILRSNTEDVLRKASATVSSHRGRQRLRNGIAVAEIACSLVLLSAAGLLIRSLVAIEHVPAGFQTEHREVTLIAIPRMRYQQDHDVVRFYDAVLERIRSAPGIVNATVLFPAPFSGRDFGTTFRLPGSTQTQFNAAELRPTDSHFLSTLELPLLSGRGFTDEDRTDSAPVCVISEAMARRYWPKQNALGRFIVLTRGDVLGTQRPRQIVGIVGDVHDRLNVQPPPTVYVPYSQVLFPSMNIIVHSAEPISALRTSIDDAVQAVDPDELVRYLVSFNELAAERTAPWRIAITMLGGLAALALLLSAIGVFAVMSYLVREKTKEFGIRVALGATPWNIRGNVLIQSLQIVLGGIVFGAALSIGATRLISGMLFGIAHADPITYAMVSLLLIVVAVLAAYIPAHRATRVDPLEALRYE
jgi:predicted permease